ncbi:hypothetical protein GVv1_47810 (plasmid) [Enterobacter pseudoroggenkampii]
MMENMTDWRTEARNIYSNEFKLYVVGLASKTWCQRGSNSSRDRRCP